MPRSPDFKRNRSIADLISDTRKPKLMPETSWYKVAITSNYEATDAKGWIYASTATEGLFKNSWGNVAGTSNPPASWYLSQNGEARLRGKITGGADGTVAFILPKELRPEYAETFIAPVDSNGNVDLSGIKFRAYQES